MTVTKKQIEFFEETNNHLHFGKKYSEEDIRELATLGEVNKEIAWGNILYYVFCHFNNYSVSFLREVRENSIKELMENYTEEEATLEVDEHVAEYILNYMNHIFRECEMEDRWNLLKDIKEGRFNEFINPKVF